MGRQEQLRGQDRLHYLAGREGQADRGGRGPSRHRPRHHVASRLEHPHPPERVGAARRCRRQTHPAIRSDQPGRRISRQDQRHVARGADHGRQPGEAVLLALRSLYAACRHRRARHLPRRRVEMGSGQDRKLELGHVSHIGAEALCGGLPGRLADGADERFGRLGRRAVQLVRRRDGRRQGQHQDQLRRNPPGHGISQETDGGEPARTSTPGTMPATTAGSFPARAPAS